MNKTIDNGDETAKNLNLQKMKLTLKKVNFIKK